MYIIIFAYFTNYLLSDISNLIVFLSGSVDVVNLLCSCSVNTEISDV